MTDPTADIRRQMLAEINAAPGSREYLEHKHGQVWSTQQLSEHFEVLGFMAAQSRRCVCSSPRSIVRESASTARRL